MKRDIGRYIGYGILVGLVAGLVESTLVHRPGLVSIPYTAVVYGLLAGAGFLILALVGVLSRRDLLPLGVAGAVTFFVALELGFWAERSNRWLTGSLPSMAVNGVVLAASLLIGYTIHRLVRRGVRRFNPLRAAVWLTVALLIALGTYSLRTRLAEAPGPNCIIVSLDALRPDHLGCYGYDRSTSPNIDRLAARGILARRAYTQSPGSTGGHASMLTGLYTLTHGAYLNGFMLSDSVDTCAELFAGNGYSTAAVTRNWYISPRVGFGQGFDCFIDNAYGLIFKSAPPRLLLRGLVLYQTFHRVFQKVGHPSNHDIVDALEWIRWRRNHKFFLFLHIMDPHSPYIPPDDIVGRFGSGAYTTTEEIERLHVESARLQLTEDEARALVDRYDEAIIGADRKIGMLVDELAGLDLLDNTLLVVTADHGEALGGNGTKQYGHGTLDYECLRIPLVMSFPQMAGEGTIIDDVVQSIDIVPTVVDALKLTDTVERQGLSLVSPEFDAAGRDRAAFATGEIRKQDDYALVTRKWLYSVSGDRVSLYDLGDDPYHAADVIADHASTADTLQAALEEWMADCISAAVVPFSIERRSVTPGKEALDRLKALGYIQ